MTKREHVCIQILHSILVKLPQEAWLYYFQCRVQWLLSMYCNYPNVWSFTIMQSTIYSTQCTFYKLQYSTQTLILKKRVSNTYCKPTDCKPTDRVGRKEWLVNAVKQHGLDTEQDSSLTLTSCCADLAIFPSHYECCIAVSSTTVCLQCFQAHLQAWSCTPFFRNVNSG